MESGEWEAGDGAEGVNGKDMACRLKKAPRRGCLAPTDFSSFDCDALPADALDLGTGVKGRSASMGSSIGVVVVGIAAAESAMWGDDRSSNSSVGVAALRVPEQKK